MIVVFGSINVDLVMRVAHHPRPGETVLGESLAIRPGGKGANQAVAAARLGAAVSMYGAVGGDAYGAEMRRNLEHAGVDVTGVRAVADAVTGCATITVDREGQNAICVASGANLKNYAEDVPDSVLGPGTTVVMQMEVPAAENWTLLARAKALGARTLLNLAPASELTAGDVEVLARAVDVLVVNETEAGQLLALLERHSRDADADARELASMLGLTAVVTAGADGACAANGDATHRAFASKVDVVDTTGAGDCFVGVLAAALDYDAPLDQALSAAAAAASLACTKVGAQAGMPDRETLRAFMASRSARR